MRIIKGDSLFRGDIVGSEDTSNKLTLNKETVARLNTGHMRAGAVDGDGRLNTGLGMCIKNPTFLCDNTTGVGTYICNC